MKCLCPSRANNFENNEEVTLFESDNDDSNHCDLVVDSKEVNDSDTEIKFNVSEIKSSGKFYIQRTDAVGNSVCLSDFVTYDSILNNPTIEYVDGGGSVPSDLNNVRDNRLRARFNFGDYDLNYLKIVSVHKDPFCELGTKLSYEVASGEADNNGSITYLEKFLDKPDEVNMLYFTIRFEDNSGNSFKTRCLPGFPLITIKPINIADRAGLEGIVSYKHYKLTASIDLSGTSWVPINDAFTGTFNGNGMTISRMNIDGLYANAGLFSEIGTTGVVYNLNIEGATVQNRSTSAESAAGIIAGTSNGTIEDISILDYNETGQPQISSLVSSYNNAGGIVGVLDGGVIRKSSSVANVQCLGLNAQYTGDDLTSISCLDGDGNNHGAFFGGLVGA